MAKNNYQKSAFFSETIEKIVKIVLLNLIIAIVNVVAFSPGLLGLKISDSDIMGTTISIFIMTLSVLMFIYFNWQFITFQKPSFTYDFETLKTPNDYFKAIKNAKNQASGFVDEITDLEEQLRKILRKNESIEEYLTQMKMDNFTVVTDVMPKSVEFICNQINLALSKIILFCAKENDDDFEDEKRQLRAIVSRNDDYLRLYDKLIDELSMRKDRNNTFETVNLESTIDALSTIRKLRET